VNGGQMGLGGASLESTGSWYRPLHAAWGAGALSARPPTSATRAWPVSASWGLGEVCGESRRLANGGVMRLVLLSARRRAGHLLRSRPKVEGDAEAKESE